MNAQMGGAGKEVSGQRQRRVWLLNLCFTALAAGAVVALGHWFSSSKGKRVGGDKGRLPRAADNVSDEEREIDNNEAKAKGTQSMPLTELRLRRLKAVEARLHSPKNGAWATSLTPLGRILKLGERVDKLEEETHSLLQKISANRVMNPLEEKEQGRLLELLTSLQIEIDGVPGDESVRPHRKSQTSRIQSLLGNLDDLEHHEILAGAVVAEVGSSSTGAGTV